MAPTASLHGTVGTLTRLQSTGRMVPKTLAEKLAMKEIKSDPSKGAVVERLKLGDPRWRGWKKMEYVHRAQDGSKIAVHYVADFKSGKIIAVDDFKFHDPK